MMFKQYKEFVNNVRAENKLLKFALIVVAAASVGSAYFSYSSVKHQKTVILPATVDKRIVITGNDVNHNYLKLFSKYTLNLAFTYTPGNFADQASDLLKICTPRFYPVLQKKLFKMEQSVKNLGITSSYYPIELQVDKEAKEIVSNGIRFKTAHGQDMENTGKKYLLTYEIIDGRFFLDGIQEITQSQTQTHRP